MYSTSVTTLVCVFVCVHSMPTADRHRNTERNQQMSEGLQGMPIVMETESIFHDPLENIGVELSNGILVEGDIRWRPNEYQTGSRMPVDVAPMAGTFHGTGLFGPESVMTDNRRNQEQFQIRNSVSMIEQIWTERIIPFVLEPGFEDNELAQIHSAMTEVMDGSENCITFVPRQYQTDFLYLSWRTDGCYSDVGRIGGNQSISLSRKSKCITKGIVMHELMHALGFWHEHTRYDRDQYVQIIEDNIITSHRSDFMINKAANQSTLPYDYYSIMHYKTNQFSMDPSLKTIYILNTSVILEEVGQRKYLTEKDKQRIRVLYNCPLTKCSYPLTLNDEQVSVRNTSVGSVVQYSCKSVNHLLIGSTERTCFFNGMWSGSTPLCFSAHSAPTYCDFEDVGICGWRQDTSDEADWTRYRSHTPSEDTGPIIDHSTQTTDGYYMYMEGTHLRPNDSARLISQEFPSQVDGCMLFWYNMYGEGMGTLNVWLQTSDGQNLKLWSLSGNQNMGWKKDLITDINSTTPYHIIIEGLRGPLDTTDMAIDDVIIGSCSDITTYQNAIIREEKADNHSCTFDSGQCGWNLTVNSAFSWSSNKGPTTSLNTGPDCDLYDCANGRYLYIESSHRTYGEAAWAMSPVIKAYGSICVTFLYHMYGEDCGNLTAYLVFPGHVTMDIWQEHGNHGNAWLTANVNQFVSSEFRLAMAGSVGQGFRGDIAIDNVQITSGACPTAIKCDFENRGFCDLVNEASSDNFDWLISAGSTVSLATGPSADHTSGTGRYVYIEASAPRIPGERARLLSPSLARSTRGYCISFWYFMYGQDVERLSVILRLHDSIESVLWSKSGNQGSLWMEANIHVHATNSNTQIVFEAVVGQSYASDIAMDDISILDGTC